LKLSKLTTHGTIAKSRFGRSVVALTACALGLVPFSLSLTQAHASGTTLSGVNAGSGPASPAAFATWRGSGVTVLNGFYPHSTWNDFAHATYGGPDGWKTAGYQMSWAVPMLPQSGGTIETGATGSYNTYFASMAKQLVADNQSNAIIRLGWEMNGDWMTWNGVNDPTAWVAYWKQIVTTMRAVPGANFKFLWSPNVDVAFDLTKLYPGDAYVDEVGMSVYDQSWAYSASQSTQRWDELYNGLYGTYGLAWLATFSKTHAKPIAFGEWGLSSRCDGHGGGDDPYFIQQMHNYIVNNNVAWEAYFNIDPADCEDHSLTAGHFPNAAAVYKTLWSQSSQPSQPASSSSSPSATPSATATPSDTPTTSASTSPTATVTASATATATASATVSTSPSETTSATPSSVSGIGQIWVSVQANRTDPTALDGADLGGPVYIWANSTLGDGASTSFWLDAPITAAPTHVETTAPYDFVGGTDTTATAFNAASLKAGTHTMIVVTQTSINTQMSTARFTVIPSLKTPALALKVTAPKRAGSHLAASAKVSGVSHPAVTFAVTDCQQHVHTYVRTGDAAGLASLTVAAACSGGVTATFAGDASHRPASKHLNFSVPSWMSVRLGAIYEKHGGVLYFGSHGLVQATCTLHPASAGRVITVSLLAYRHGHWVKEKTLKLRSTRAGSVVVPLKAAHTHRRYRLSFSFAGDQFNGRSTAASHSFVIG
jgi:Glycosyl hydrolase family 26